MTFTEFYQQFGLLKYPFNTFTTEDEREKGGAFAMNHQEEKRENQRENRIERRMKELQQTGKKEIGRAHV